MSGLIAEMTQVVKEVIDDDMKAKQVVSRIIRRFGGGTVYMPTEDYRTRNEMIKELVRAGASIDDVARKFRLSKPSIYRIVGRNNKRRGRKPSKS